MAAKKKGVPFDYDWKSYVSKKSRNRIGERGWNEKNHAFEDPDDYFKYREINPIFVATHGPFHFIHKPFRKFGDKGVERVIAKLRSQSESVDRLWHELEDEEVKVSPVIGGRLDKTKSISVVRRKQNWPVGKYVFNELGKIETNFDVMDPKYDDKDIVATQKIMSPHVRNMLPRDTCNVRNEYRLTGIIVMQDDLFRQLFFDMLYIIERNAINKDELMKVLGVNRQLLSQLTTVAASFGMVIVIQARMGTINKMDGTFYKRPRRALTIASWGCIAKSIIIGHGRRTTASFRTIDCSDMHIGSVKKRQAMIDRIHLAIYKSDDKAEAAIKQAELDNPKFKNIPDSGVKRNQRDIRKIIEGRREEVAQGIIGNRDCLVPIHEVVPVCGVPCDDKIPSSVLFKWSGT